MVGGWWDDVSLALHEALTRAGISERCFFRALLVLNGASFVCCRASQPIFARGAVLPDVVLKPGDKGAAPASLGVSTSSQCGQYWHDPLMEENDPAMAVARSQNGIRRLLPVESNSQFALEDLPTQHRLL